MKVTTGISWLEKVNTKKKQDAYDLLKGRTRHQHQQGPTKIGLSLHNNRGEDTTALVNDGAKDKYPICGCDNHNLADCSIRRHLDGTVLYIMGDIKKCDEGVSAEFSSTFNICCYSELEELMLIQPHKCSSAEKQNMCSKNEILKSTVDVISNVDLLTEVHWVKTTLRTRCNTGMKTKDQKGHLSG